MRFEAYIALRYLVSRRTATDPSVIAAITTAGIALAVTTLIVVLAVVGGFEGDLRQKILNTRAHILITGPEHAFIDDPEPVVEVLRGLDVVEGYSPFVEAELMIAMPTRYSPLILRGVDPELVRTTTTIDEDLTEGDLGWMFEPHLAADYRMQQRFGAPETNDDLSMGDIERLQRDIETMTERIGDLKDEATSGSGAAQQGADSTDGQDPEIRAEAAAGTEEPGAGLIPPLPPPRNGANDDDASAGLIPGLPSPGGTGDDENDNEPYDPTDINLSDLPRDAGVIIGSGVQKSLYALTGDTVNIINPEGDLGPQGPIPRSRPFRIAGIFHSGLFEFDSTHGYTTMAAARDLMGFEQGVVTGIEVRVANVDDAETIAREIESAMVAAGVDQVDVRSWQDLNRSLFGALALEKLAIAFGVGTIILVAGVLILLVLWMFVTDKQREIAVLRSVGARRSSITLIFAIQGFAIGLVGTMVGSGLGLLAVYLMETIGVPLPAEVYYIDTVPVELAWRDVVAINIAALLTTIAGSLPPALHAGALDPVEGLRRE